MGRVAEYRATLRELPARAWDAYLTEHSGLPGRRANLELMAAVAQECPVRQAHRFSTSPDEFLAMCGAASLGPLAVNGDPDALPTLHRLAADARWRIREAVAMGLQRIGDADPDLFRATVREWAADPHPLVQRAAVAGICEPRLVVDPDTARQALDVLDLVTQSLADRPATQRRAEDVRTLRQALGYCWSVAVAAAPEAGFDRLDRWAALDDLDLRWVIRENLKKTRLRKADPDRVSALHTALAD
jgi:hypothetical protein